MGREHTLETAELISFTKEKCGGMIYQARVRELEAENTKLRENAADRRRVVAPAEGDADSEGLAEPQEADHA